MIQIFRLLSLPLFTDLHAQTKAISVAEVPPIGLNSCGYTVYEDQINVNINYVAKNQKLYGWKYFVVDLLLCSCLSFSVGAQGNTTLTPEFGQSRALVSPMLCEIMTEEMNHSYDRWMYAEMIRNRIFKDDPKNPAYWSGLQTAGGKGMVALDHRQPINDALPVCLRLKVNKPECVGIANECYWGIPVRPNTVYQGSFYAKTARGTRSLTGMSKDFPLFRYTGILMMKAEALLSNGFPDEVGFSCNEGKGEGFYKAAKYLLH